MTGEFSFDDAAADRRMAQVHTLRAYAPYLLRYPLTSFGLPFIVAFAWPVWAFGRLVGPTLYGVSAIIGSFFFAIAISYFMQRVVEHTARGHALPPALDAGIAFLVDSRLYAQPVFAGAVALAWFFARGHAWGAAVLPLACVIWPAYTLITAIERGILNGFNPLRWFVVMAGAGPAYAVIALLCVGALGLVGSTDAGMWGVGATAVALYLLVLVCHALGFIAYHRHEALGITVQVARVTDASRREDEQERRLKTVLRLVDAALSRKDLKAAADAICVEPGGPADVRRFHEELFEQLSFKRNVDLLHLQGQRLITVLIEGRRLARALDVAEQCFDAHRDFAPETAAQAVLLAGEALRLQRDSLFERLTEDAPKRWAGRPEAVSLQFLSAKYWYERRRDEKRAREALAPLLALRDHPQHLQIVAYGRVLAPSTTSTKGTA